MIDSPPSMGLKSDPESGGTAGRSAAPPDDSATGEVARQLRRLRTGRGLSLRALAEASGLSVNTLSLVENGKSSPSVSTLQRLAAALRVPITAFFEEPSADRTVVFLKADGRGHAKVEHGTLERLAAGFTSRAVQPFIVHLQPGGGSGPDPIVHTGYEFVYCLAGRLTYRVEGQAYVLEPGDSLLFESRLPHCWSNDDQAPVRALLVLVPTDERDAPSARHFMDVGHAAS